MSLWSFNHICIFTARIRSGFLVLLGRFWGSFLEVSAVHESRITAEPLLVGLKLWVFLGLVLLHVRVEISEIPLFMTFDPFFWISCDSWLDELFVY